MKKAVSMLRILMLKHQLLAIHSVLLNRFSQILNVVKQLNKPAKPLRQSLFSHLNNAGVMRHAVKNGIYKPDITSACVAQSGIFADRGTGWDMRH